MSKRLNYIRLIPSDCPDGTTKTQLARTTFQCYLLYISLMIVFVYFVQRLINYNCLTQSLAHNNSLRIHLVATDGSSLLRDVGFILNECLSFIMFDVSFLTGSVGT
jgi:hypothetical protein